jgi:iron complex outermembrane recepter protein
MKRILLSVFSFSAVIGLFGQDQKTVTSQDSVTILEPVEVRAIRAGENAPFTKTNLTKKEIEKLNLGQDLPFILNQTPSVVVNSDAGNGIGYTGIRIRGTDATRINVTLNGIPYNDAESQGTFFVDLPDFISSVNSIQIQRGVGTSSNGAGAFGASINISTNDINKTAFAEFNNSFGSFNSWKHTLKMGSGLINDHFTADIRLSKISSDGYIDRARSDLKSFYFSTAYMADNSSIRLNIFSGKEKTYQAWYGVPEKELQTNRTMNIAGTEKPGNPYDNETDNYKQDHYQLFYSHQFNKKISFNTAAFLTKGKGYYEQYKAGEAYANYNIPAPVSGNDTSFTSDLIRQLWLDNDFYGTIYSLQYKNSNSQFTFGGSWSKYDGAHFGKVIWAEKGLNKNGHWYDLDAKKTDFTVYAKLQQKLNSKLSLFADIQYRNINYQLNGFRDNPTLFVKNHYDFINPKIGLSFNSNDWFGYLSYSAAAKEPNRDDFEAVNTKQPRPEKLHDFELGMERRNQDLSWGATIYYMKYNDQLILTGQINDVGAYTRTNISDSYRFGVELQGKATITKWLKTSLNFTISRNKLENFVEYIDDYDAGGQKIMTYASTDIAFSPSIIAGNVLTFLPVQNLELSLFSKYVGSQYLDNTQNDNRKLNSFYLQDARILYSLKKLKNIDVDIIFQINNIFYKKYEPNGYTYSYIYGAELITENFYYPMAGRNFMGGVNVKF